MENLPSVAGALALVTAIFFTAGKLAPAVNLPPARHPGFWKLVGLTFFVALYMLTVLTVMWSLLTAFPSAFTLAYKFLVSVITVILATAVCRVALARFGKPPTRWRNRAASLCGGIMLAGPAYFAPNWLTIDLCASVVCVGLLIGADAVAQRRLLGGLSLQYCAAILIGIVIYDVIGVFFTPMMLEVATAVTRQGNDIPVMMHFPATLRLDSDIVFVLGLGDVVLPGIVMMLGFREARRHDRASLIIGPWIGYVLGLIAAMVALRISGVGQPATIYLVPGVLGGLVFAARLTGKHREVWSLRRPQPPTSS